MASGITVEIRGAKQLARALGGRHLLDEILRPGFEKAAVIVEGAAKDNVHRVTGKLQQSLGNYITGRGADIEAHIGPQPGLDQPRHYSKAMTTSWKTPRDGVNTGDPQEYATYEEGSPNEHPFLEPALLTNEQQIEDVITREATRRLGRIRGI